MADVGVGSGILLAQFYKCVRQLTQNGALNQICPVMVYVVIKAEFFQQLLYMSLSCICHQIHRHACRKAVRLAY